MEILNLEAFGLLSTFFLYIVNMLEARGLGVTRSFIYTCI
jgi:hypothetical protein